ncbi:thioredoxin family protein [Nocardia sp. NPDC127526]|uniref:thioredoxin family protein n=1 Tax=Nocardia sp. NPDC127526 TaxID=3345393 RepID=UPI003635EB30
MATRALGKHDFQQTVTSNHIVLVNYWADWCGWCKRFAPVYKASAETHPQIVHATVEGEVERELSAAIQLTGFPTIMAYREGLPVYKNAGFLTSAQLEDVVQQVLWMDMDEFRRKNGIEQQARQQQAPAARQAPPNPNRAGLAGGAPQYGWPGLRTR